MHEIDASFCVYIMAIDSDEKFHQEQQWKECRIASNSLGIFLWKTTYTTNYIDKTT